MITTPALNDRSGDIGCNVAMCAPHVRSNAASAISAAAQVRFVRILPVRARRSEGPVYNFSATPWL
ncbi:MAG: hypothetical protein AAFY84_17600 [Pseudomonadota bacterium]